MEEDYKYLNDPDVKFLKLYHCNDDFVCAACKALASQPIPKEKAPDLPYAACTSVVGCRCSYGAVIQRPTETKLPLLQQAVAAIKAGDKSTGQKLLLQLLEADPNHETALLWLAATTENLTKKRMCFERVLAINPGNERARQALAALDAPEPAEAPPLEMMTGRQPPPVPVAPLVSEPPPVSKPQAISPQKKSSPWATIGLILAICGGCLIAVIINDFLAGGLNFGTGYQITLIVQSNDALANISYLGGTDIASSDLELAYDGRYYYWQKELTLSQGEVVSLTAHNKQGGGIACVALVNGQDWLRSAEMGLCSITGTVGQ